MFSYKNLLAQKADLEKQLFDLSVPEDSENILLSNITSQRVYYFKNKPRIIFHSNTGCIFPNIDYFDQAFKVFRTGSCGMKSDMETEMKNVCIEEIDGYGKFRLPDNNTIKYYIRSVSEIVTTTATFILCNESSVNRDGDIVRCFDTNGTHENIILNRAKAFAFPFCSTFSSENFFPDSKVFSATDRAKKIINLFTNEGWHPKFDSEDTTTLYEKIYILRPPLETELIQINEKLAEMPLPKLGLADSIDFADMINGYDPDSIGESPVRYNIEMVRWFSELLVNLDEFCREQAMLLADARSLTNRLRKNHVDNDDTIFTERGVYLAKHLDFGMESLQEALVSFKQEATANSDALMSARTLTELREFEKLELPDFNLVAAHSIELVKKRLQAIEWFQKNKILSDTIVSLHHEWRNDLHNFEYTTRTHFRDKCTKMSIETEKAEEWFAEWRRERILAEEHLLPLLTAGFERVIPIEIVIDAISLLKTSVRDQLGRFFYDERINLHIEKVTDNLSDLEEHVNANVRLTTINSNFQKQLEELIFKVQDTEGRLFLVRWAKNWYDSLVGDILTYIEKDELCEQIARETLDGFRDIKRHTMEAFLLDVKSYADARAEKDKEWKLLLFKMKNELGKFRGAQAA